MNYVDFTSDHECSRRGLSIAPGASAGSAPTVFRMRSTSTRSSALALALSALSALAAPAAAQADADSLLLETAAAVVRTAPECAAQWPGFWSRDPPFMLTVKAGERMLLVVPGGAPPAEGWRPVDPATASAELRGRAYLGSGFPAGFRGFHIARRVGDVVLPAVPVEERPLAGNVYLLVHEAFHAFQLARFTFDSARLAADAAPPRPALDSAGAAAYEALAEAERATLARALAARSEAERRRQVRGYLALRGQRTAMAPEVAEYERYIEVLEGTAELVGYRCAARAAGHPLGRAEEYVVGGLAEPKPALLGGVVSRWRGYAVGAAIGMLLDAERVEWRARVESGAALDELLGETVAP